MSSSSSPFAFAIEELGQHRRGEGWGPSQGGDGGATGEGRLPMGSGGGEHPGQA